jgi:hypothetical protein
MKFTSGALIALLLILIAGLFCSNIILKKEYDSLDKTDIYWNYEKVLQQPFKHLKIIGGNLTRIAFEQSPKYSVRILQEWKRYHGGKIQAQVKNDTLFINFDFIPSNLYEKFWMRGITAVRIFSPELLSVNGHNTNFEMFKLKQKSINVSITGKSKFEVESLIRSLDTLNISQRDTSEVVFEMSPEYQTTIITDATRIGVRVNETQQINSNEAMSINSVKADLQGYSLLDVGHAQIQSLQLQIADSSGIILSGGALKRSRFSNFEK